MVCNACGATIAEKAIVCYRCGAPTAAPAARSASPAGRRVRPATIASGVLAVALGALTLVVPDDSTSSAGGGRGSDPRRVEHRVVLAEAVALARNQVVGLELRAKDVGHDTARRVLNVLGVELHAEVIELRDDDGIAGRGPRRRMCADPAFLELTSIWWLRRLLVTTTVSCALRPCGGDGKAVVLRPECHVPNRRPELRVELLRLGLGLLDQWLKKSGPRSVMSRSLRRAWALAVFAWRCSSLSLLTKSSTQSVMVDEV